MEKSLSTPFQNRLVGTLVVTAAIVIFLPGILDGEKKSYQSDFDNIPKTPIFTGKMVDKQFPESLKPKKEQPKLSDDLAQDDALRLDDEQSHVVVNKSNTDDSKANASKIDKSATKKSEKNAVVKKKKPTISSPKPLPPKATVNEAWVIQLGSFKNKKNVEQLIAKLKRNGYVVFTRPIQTQKGSLIKVFVGPELIKSSIEKKLPHLKSLTGVKGKVASFQPTK